MRPLVALLLAAPLAAETVTLDDGRVIEGELLSAPGAPVLELRVSAGGASGVQRIEREHVTRIETGPSARQQALTAIAAKRALLGDGGEAEDWVELAKQARAAGDPALAKELAGEAVRRDRQNTDAHRILGESRQNGVWMRPREAAVARGEVFFRGRWVSYGERESTLAAEEKARLDAEAERRRLLEQRAADAALAKASEPPATQVDFSTYQAVPHVMYWQNYPYYPVGGYTQGYSSSCGNGYGLSVQAAGHWSNGAWALSWNP
jgi:hypothetical protein